MRPLITLVAITLTAAALAACIGPAEPTSGDAGPSEVIVDMKDLKFAPETITVAPGTTVTWVNVDPFQHTVTPVDKDFWGTQGSGDDMADWIDEGGTWSFTFEEEGTFVYYCIPHASQQADGSFAGMVGTVIVEAGAATGGGGQAAAGPGPAQAVDVDEIGRSGMDVPSPIDRSEPAHLEFDITSEEVVAEMADGTTYEYWTFDGQVPGPMLRGRVGDTVTINLHNPATSTMGHNIDFHAVTGPGGGAAVLNADPGETATGTFKLLNPGLYIYHCAFQDPPLHIAHGMYGLILVEPEEGLPPVDEEFYIVQGDFYSPFKASQQGHHAYDGDRAAAENPTFVTFNGRMGSLMGPGRQLEADVGDTVRMFVGNGGPNLVSSFHVIGEIFDRAWDQGGIGHDPQENIQTTLVPAGGAAMVEFDLETSGDYFLVDHSIFRIHKGAFGILHVEGDADEDVYREGP